MKRNSMTVVLLVAAAFLVVGLLNIAVYWFKNYHDHTSMNLWHILYLSIPLVIGIVILVKSSALAARVDEYLDE
jgi:hypothetical protein